MQRSRSPREATARFCCQLLTPLVGHLLFAVIAHAAANTIADIAWTIDRSGNTIVYVTATGPLDPSSYRAYAVTDPPRIVMRFSGVDAPFLPATIPVGTADVSGLRIGFHRQSVPPELHVVVDTESDAVRILEIRHNQNRLDLVIGASPAPQMTSDQSPPETTAGLNAPDRPPPPVLPVGRAGGTPQPSVAPPHPAPPAALPTNLSRRVARAKAAHLTEVTASRRGDGSTLVRITADGTFPAGCARVIEIDQGAPRVVVTIRSVTAPDLERSIEIDDPNVERVRLIHDAETSHGELHLVFELGHSDVKMIELEQLGPHLVARFGVPDTEIVRR